MSLPVGHAFIYHTSEPLNCLNGSSCISVVKWAQNLHMDRNGWDDIGYNGLVGGDGRVYIGRSWHTVNSRARGMFDLSVNLAFIGNYDQGRPTLEQLDVAKQWLQCAREMGALRRDYQLHGHRDIQCNTTSPGQHLYDLIRQWPNFQGGPLPAYVCNTTTSAINLRHNQLAYRTPLPPKQAYDYIVVGAGSAGSILACRLSQWGLNVILLEEGGPVDAVFDDIPGLTLDRLATAPSYRYYSMQRQQLTGHSYRNNGRQTLLMGRVLGGGSTVNGLLYNRGNRKFYDTIASKYGAIGWDYASVLPVFKQMENNTDPRVSDQYHGRQGPVGVSTPGEPYPIYLIQAQVAGREWGLDLTDINGANQTGFTIAQSTIVGNGLRSSTSNAYLENSSLCPQLTIVTGARVSKVIIKHTNTLNNGDIHPRAQGVQYHKYNRTYNLWANREVIISAGPIASPQLLMLSGVGPADHLNSIPGIGEVYADLPGVGSNLCDHLGVTIDLPVRPQQQSSTSSTGSLVGQSSPKLYNLTQLIQVNLEGQGPMSQLSNTIMYMSSQVNPDKSYPDLFIMFTAKQSGSLPEINLYKPINQSTQPLLNRQFDQYIHEISSTDYLRLAAELIRPDSCRGTVRLMTSSIDDQPVIDPNYLPTDTTDRQRLREAIRESFRFAETTSFRQYVRTPSVPMPPCRYCSPGSGSPIYQCPSYLDCLIDSWAGTEIHMVGTCRMGDPQRRDTVVDPRLRVKGIQGLRVVDSSVYPEAINGNTNAGAMLAGEMGARFIREDWWAGEGLQHNQVANRTPLPPKHRYDYIVVGGGTAGAIVACRLSEWGSDVLLLEEGGPVDALLDDIHSISTDKTRQAYRFYNISRQQSTGHSYLNMGQQVLIGAKVLGGGSTINGLVYNRGNRKYYDMIASKYGAIGWDYASVLPVFKLMENNTDPRVMDEYHGRQGPVGISTPGEPYPIYLKQAEAAAREWGLDYTDINGANQTGFTIAQLTIGARGLRSSTNNAYLESGLCPQLTIVTRAQVSKVIIKRNNNNDTARPLRAQGVEFRKNNRTYSVLANREVILSAGPIASPQLLMLSGIGPANHLNGIQGIGEVYVDLPGVGSNLCDTVGVPLDLLIRQPYRGRLIGQSASASLDNLTQLIQVTLEGRGPMSEVVNSVMYWSTSGNRDKSYPDLLVKSNARLSGALPLISSYAPTSNTTANSALLHRQFEQYTSEHLANDNLVWSIELARPDSCQGQVRLRTSSIDDQPEIDPNYLPTGTSDRRRLREAVRETIRFAETTSFRQYVRLPSIPMPPCRYCSPGSAGGEGSPVYKCQSYMDCLIDNWAGTVIHMVGGCRMGDPQRRDTVVDPRLRVKGIQGLRVCDSSVYPEVINANTMAAAMLAGEMGARFIREDYGN
ncbi:uncharacterized protein LOC128953380 [Oppia nitens]|uniref:uncharacterized protein LOC128953380 n=1 Tax=Oppia nitens TaxID=1686743 RepID=UPI0023DAE162|nr:uncharacterized protein LOC128953380 [Oppia nitens]